MDIYDKSIVFMGYRGDEVLRFSMSDNGGVLVMAQAPTLEGIERAFVYTSLDLLKKVIAELEETHNSLEGTRKDDYVHYEKEHVKPHIVNHNE